MRAWALLVVPLIAGCGLDSMGTGDAPGPDGSAADVTVTSIEASVDAEDEATGIPIADAADVDTALFDDAIAPPPDAGPSGYMCPGVGQVSSCEGCNDARFQCGARCVADCSDSCDAGPNACEKCSGDEPHHFCALLDGTQSCSSFFTHCACPNGFIDLCPLESDVCVGFVCASCGEPGTDGQTCKNGKKCRSSSGKFACN
jgi:hypothetical protein